MGAASITRAERGRLFPAALLRGLPLVLLLIGLSARLAPLLDPDGRGLRQFPTEDGYLMLTIARNVALGRGMSIAEGTIPTNGTQPLMTWVYAAGFRLVGGDRVAGVWLAQALQILVALAACLLVERTCRRLLEGQPAAERLAAVTAALWFASPLTLRHAQNCLETGPYVLTLLMVAGTVLGLPSGDRRWPLARCVGLGLLLALAFWMRNDAALLVAAVCLARTLPALGRGAGVLWRRGVEAGLVGATALAGALPWLVSNQLRFGSIMPISGVAEQSKGSFGGNLPYLPAPLAEYAAVVLQIPSSLERHPVVMIGSTLLVGISVAGGVALARRLDPAARAWLATAGLWAVFTLLFYGLWFGVGFFVTRYFFPFSWLFALVAVTWTDRALDAAPLRAAVPLRRAGAVVLAGVVALLALRLHAQGDEHGHFQVVEWVRDNVADEAWVGAVQTGTLGFFHDRTINLDGKVNPYALRARLAGRTQEYVVATPITVLADWPGIERWLEKPAFHGRFELAVDDPARRLVVLRRTGPPDPSATPSGGFPIR